jgi:hypothetical protein
MRQARGADHSQETPCLRQEGEEVRVTKGHQRVKESTKSLESPKSDVEQAPAQPPRVRCTYHTGDNGSNQPQNEGTDDLKMRETSTSNEGSIDLTWGDHQPDMRDQNPCRRHQSIEGSYALG